MQRRRTRRGEALDRLRRYPGQTATELAHAMSVHVADLSSELKRMFDAGLVTRSKGEGPYGGYGYWVK